MLAPRRPSGHLATGRASCSIRSVRTRHSPDAPKAGRLRNLSCSRAEKSASLYGLRQSNGRAQTAQSVIQLHLFAPGRLIIIRASRSELWSAVFACDRPNGAPTGQTKPKSNGRLVWYSFQADGAATKSLRQAPPTEAPKMINRRRSGPSRVFSAAKAE